MLMKVKMLDLEEDQVTVNEKIVGKSETFFGSRHLSFEAANECFFILKYRCFEIVVICAEGFSLTNGTAVE
jgi:hypothetical protein